MSEPFGGWFRGRRVLVTGHTGFKGAWLATWLAALGADVVGYALDPPSDPSAHDLLGVDRLVDGVVGDVRDHRAVAKLVDEHRPEAVLHLAAQPLVPRSWDDPRETFETNVLGTVNVLDAAVRSAATRAVVVVTSDKCYDNVEWDWPYREDDRLGGRDPYSASKAAAELAVRPYLEPSPFRPAGAPVARVVTARAGNVIGGGDFAEARLVPDVARALAAGRPVVLRDPTGVRPWQHVLEPLSGYLLLAARLAGDAPPPSAAYNLGPAPQVTGVPAAELVRRCVAAWGAPEHPVAAAPDGAVGEARLLRLDASLAWAELGWRALWDTERAVVETMRWYRAHHDGDADLAGLAWRQIDGYTDEARAAGLRWAGGAA